MENKKDTIFKVSEFIDIKENNTLSLVDENVKNIATVVINDCNVKVYYPDGNIEDYGNKFNELLLKATTNGWSFMKLLNGDTRWKKFNPNPKGKNVEDCSIRAYCAARDMKWDDAFDLACKVAKQEKDIINSVKVCRKVVTEHLGFVLNEESKKVKIKDRMTVNQFALTHNYGRYIVSVRGHLVAVIDGWIYDSWDCGSKKMLHFYEEATKK